MPLDLVTGTTYLIAEDAISARERIGKYLSGDSSIRTYEDPSEAKEQAAYGNQHSTAGQSPVRVYAIRLDIRPA
jgi:hypothetical protein